MVYYHIPTDQIFMDWKLDCCFFGLLRGPRWADIEILGELDFRGEK